MPSFSAPAFAPHMPLVRDAAHPRQLRACASKPRPRPSHRRRRNGPDDELPSALPGLSRRSLLAAAAAAALVPTMAAADGPERAPPPIAKPAAVEGQMPPAAGAAGGARGKVAWGYAGEIGPDHWAGMSPEYAACGNVGTQSPVALSYRSARKVEGEDGRPVLKLEKARFAALKKQSFPGAINHSAVFDVYRPPPPPIVGDAPPMDAFRPSSGPAVMTIPDVGQFTLQTFHFHAPSSEHVINNSRGLLEAHFVFKRTASSQRRAEATGGEAATDPMYAVVGLLFNEAEETAPWLRTVMNVLMPEKGDGDFSDFPDCGRLVDLDLATILPNLEETDIYSYTGSLTTPPGTEGIQWYVLGSRADVTRADTAKLVSAQGGPNFRPLQELGDRRVMMFPSAAKTS